MSVVESTYFPRPSFDMTRIKREQRDTASRKLQNENQKVLDRIMSSKPSIKLEEFIKHEREYKKLKKQHNKEFAPAKHGYPARGSERFKTVSGDDFF